ncbi:Crp/Fnr family transcriptional regulator [Leptothrix discophora]|uniref:Crp/Fnr family transcriptional regulator n=1 Tax=Leptothrix discophora TaxID=89 RepID=A0ABT9G3L9_LEPDI|nr:Crp/Fnr family transcriptional regulator [Leptothrix discophora]MDP4301090.1 Crp/Fnr family transcriptional regulator [Leptothrix discophora]
MNQPVQGEVPALSGLRGVYLLRDVPDDVLAEVGRVCRFKLFRARQPVMSRDDRDQDCYLILSGRVRVVALSPNGREVSFREAGAGETIGEMSAIDGLPRSATVVALQDALLARLHPQDLLALMRRHWSINERMLQHLARAARGLTERVYELSALNVSQRLCAELLRQSQVSGGTGTRLHRMHRLDPAPSHSELAARVSCTREQVTRELGDLRRDGVLSGAAREALVLDIARLAERVAGLAAGAPPATARVDAGPVTGDTTVASV